MSLSECIFCKIIDRQIPSSVIAETDEVIVIKDIHPKNPIHYLIIPKKHVTDLQSLDAADSDLAGKLLMMARSLSRDITHGDFRLVINSGKQAGQEVFHLHVHFLAGQPMKF